jgi:hypothetical protein
MTWGSRWRLGSMRQGGSTDMTIGIRCLLVDEPAEARRLATRARRDSIIERRQIEARMQTEALAAVRGLADPIRRTTWRNGLCLFDESWHQGVVGLVASRIKDRNQPAGDRLCAPGRWRDLRGSASARSPGLHIRDVLDAIAAQPDAHRALRRPCDGGRHDACTRRISIEFAAGFRCGGRPAGLAGGQLAGCHRNRWRTDRGGAGTGDRRRAARRGTLGAAVSGAELSTAFSWCAIPASSGSGT